jgi:hypothetical protein
MESGEFLQLGWRETWLLVVEVVSSLVDDVGFAQILVQEIN